MKKEKMTKVIKKVVKKKLANKAVIKKKTAKKTITKKKNTMERQ